MRPVRKAIVVNAAVHDAFTTFTEDVDAWWPRTHHIGRSPMLAVVIEARAGGRCYTRHEDGSMVVWARVVRCDAPRRIVLAWQITHEFQFQPDPAAASEVDVRFTPLAPTVTRVDLEHRLLEQHGAGAVAMREIVDGANGWARVLGDYQRCVDHPPAARR